MVGYFFVVLWPRCFVGRFWGLLGLFCLIVFSFFFFYFYTVENPAQHLHDRKMTFLVENIHNHPSYALLLNSFGGIEDLEKM